MKAKLIPILNLKKDGATSTLLELEDTIILLGLFFK